jgi:predicted PurR-regulated permease PerM
MLLKKVTTIIVFGLLLTGSAPAIAAAPVATPYETNNPLNESDPRVQQMLERLKQIKQIDKSAMTKTEKKDLRKEVKGIRKEMKTISGGVYLSVGAIIVVILLLLLIL